MISLSSPPMGSPPRVRGKGPHSARNGSQFRITPACAGKRRVYRPKARLCGDHPRVCGEKPYGYYQKDGHEGSPPRVRGKATHGGIGAILRGITPACAGKSTLTQAMPAGGRDHPRVCGEKRDLRGGLFFIRGSPPRVRGKGFPVLVVETAVGITPACAGKSRAGYRCRPRRRDHPRVCGEKFATSL